MLERTKSQIILCALVYRFSFYGLIWSSKAVLVYIIVNLYSTIQYNTNTDIIIVATTPQSLKPYSELVLFYTIVKLYNNCV